jgi:diguanylate cyclase (GGDEF)-like protein
MLHPAEGEIPLAIILLLSVILQAAAAIIAASQINAVKRNYVIAWICVSFALILMVERRLAPLWRLVVEGQSSSFLDANFGLAISIFMLIGNYGVRQLFRNLELQNIELEQLANFDTLTGLDNRRSVLEKAKFEMSRALRTEHQFSFLMMDIDHFKKVNDTFGHAAGDKVLHQIAEIMVRELRNIDICGRIGGEEFLVVMPDTNLDKALIAAERLRMAVASCNFHLSDQAFPITISIGAVVPSLYKEASLDALLAEADRALYKAKSNGRNRVEAALNV